ncbi:adipocyte plasma membrane-associated protein [Elysia marginata]|uniref:Adipocyte plasma membrane-associated protein n=1 Tax=Elysia marginata TaxID=1093978 RepID=A0AAV4HIT3_9GAST|nr:adipocyte plasma membrane-associated protein [Elysia marginata]
MSDASAVFDYASRFWIMFEGRPDGRLIALTPSTGHVEEITANLAYPSGLEMTADRRAFLVAEAARSRIYRVELDKNRRYHKSFFRENLPGMPQHIRQASKGMNRGSYWVGLTFPRHQGDVSVLDQYSTQPAARNFLAKRRNEQQLRMMYSRRGLAVELDAEGRVIKSMHDPTSSKVTEVIEVNEHGGLAYVGTRSQNAVIRVVTSANRLSIDTMIQVMRSRCKVSEDKIPEAREALRRQILRRKSAATSSQIPSSANSQASATQSKQAARQLSYTQVRQKIGRPNLQSTASSPKSIRQGLSRIQKILNQRGLQNKKSSTGNMSTGKQAPNPPQSPAKTIKNAQQASITPNYTIPPQPQSFSQGQTRYQQQQSVPQLPPQNSFDQSYAKSLVRSPHQSNQLTFPDLNSAGLQTHSLPGVPPTYRDKMYPNSIRQSYLQNISKPPNIPIPSTTHYDQHTSGTGHVYAPNGNVPRPFSATGYQQGFAAPSPPQNSLRRPNLGQLSGSYQDSSPGSYANYRPPQTNVPTDPDPNNPFLPHGLVPTGHHSAAQSTHHDGGNKPQIVHKVVDGQMITQIIVPDIDKILYDTAEPMTTISPLFIPLPKPTTYKPDMFKPQTSFKTLSQAPFQTPPQNEKEKKLALGGFLGITPKPSAPAPKVPVFNLGPEMVNTLPEFGQTISSGLDASPIGIYGHDSSARQPTAAESNAAIALSMFTGVSGSTVKPPPTFQGVTTSPSPQGQEQHHEAQFQYARVTTNTVTAEETQPTTAARLEDKNHPKEITNVQNLQMFHPGEDSFSSTVPRDIVNSNSAVPKSTNSEPKQSLLKRGLQQLHHLFRQEETGQNQPKQQLLDNPTQLVRESMANEHKQTSTYLQALGTGMQTDSRSDPMVASTTEVFPTPSGVVRTSSTFSFVSRQNEALPTTENKGLLAFKEQEQMVQRPSVGSTFSSIPTSPQNSASVPTTGTSLVPAFSGAAAIHPRQHKDVNQLENEAQQQTSLFSSLVETPHSRTDRNRNPTHRHRPFHNSNQAQPPQELPRDQRISSYLSQSSPPNHQDNMQESQQHLALPNSRPQVSPNTGFFEQSQLPLSAPTSSANQNQQTDNSHGFIQIYQDGKYIVIPLSPNMLQSLSSSLGSAITGPQPSNLPTASIPQTAVSTVNSHPQDQVSTASGQPSETQPSTSPGILSIRPGNTPNHQQTSKTSTSSDRFPQRQTERISSDTKLQGLPAHNQQIPMNDNTAGLSSLVQSFTG